MVATNIRVKILNLVNDMPLVIGKTYKANFETQTHYIIFNNNVWCGILKDNVEVLEGE